MLDSRLKAYGLSAMVFAIDRLSKSIIEAHVSPFDDHPVIPGFFDIVHSQNRGVAFGLMNESNSAWRTVVVFAIDRLSKSIVEAHVSPFDVHPVIPGFFDIVHSQNRGVAFGLMNESNSAWRTVVLISPGRARPL